ncbi:MAG: hypothetical protein EON93_08185 [Burkholderiales bacterium]|nr:MAG: hypothetical protein EON93_08185 [Burkholderiales bacterium]
MFQRDAAHTGYVPVTLDPAKFVKAWEWITPNHARFGGLVSANGAVYVSAGRKVFRLNESTGAVVWEHATPNPGGDWTGPPGYHDGVVYFPIQPPSRVSVIRGLDAETGTPKTESVFNSQAGPYIGPTFYDGGMYYSAGFYGNFAYRYNLPSGALAWSSRLGPDALAYMYMQTPAVDENHIYHMTENGIYIARRSDGAALGAVPAQTGGSGALTGPSAPVITESGLVLKVDFTDSARLVAIDPVSRTIAWRGSFTGGGMQPVTAGDKVYHWVGSGGWMISAMDAKTGAALWSWRLPATDSQPIENMVVTDNMLFASSNRAVYAIDLNTHQTVWRIPTHGKLSISSNRILHILQSDFGVEDSTVTAVRLD